MTKPENTPQAAEANEHEADNARQVVDNTATQAADAGDEADDPEDEQPVDHTETVNRLLTDDLRKRFDAIGIGGLEGAVAAALNQGKTEEQITEELNSDIEQLETQQADRKAHAEKMEAEAKAEARRIERLTTASIILGPIIGGAPEKASRKTLVADALGYADDLIAQVDKA